MVLGGGVDLGGGGGITALDRALRGVITSTIHVLILVPVFFVLMKERALRRGTLLPDIGNEPT